jgi:2-keto-4-pentenoate hydratase/2-oxohepta-3-ene-1,7-dioic acid hydratase in catechol pathway
MVFGVAAIIEHLTSIMTLYPGDIIATGTPAGVGHGKGEYLKAGDVVSMEVGPLGELVTPII